MAIKEEVVISVNTDSSQAEGSVKSLKQQLREAQADVAKMAEKFGDTSVQAAEAAKKAAGLKDRIGDAKALTEAFNPDKKFNSVAGALSGVAGGFAAVQGAMGLLGAKSEDVEKMMLKVQSAMALSQGLSAITESMDAFKNLKTVAVNAMNSIKAAIGSTGIGLLVIAVGAIYAYWDDIKAAVSGVNEETKKAAESAKKKLATSERELKAVDDTSNILRLQGKTEKEILQIKSEKIKKSIADAKVNLEQQTQIAEAQTKAEKRNYEILKKIARFGLEADVAVLRLIAAPLDALIVTANKIAETLGFSKIVSSTINEEISKLTSEGSEKIAKLVFDPEKTAQKGEESIQAAKDILKQLENQEAGYKLDINKIDAESNKTKKDQTDKSADEILQANKKANEDILKLQQENTLARISDDRMRAQVKLEMDLESAKKEIGESKASAELKAKQIQALEEKYMLDLNVLKQKYRAEDDKKAKEQLDKQLKAEEETFRIYNEARINKIKDENIKRQELEAVRYQKDIDTLMEALNNKEITQADYDIRAQTAKEIHEQKLTDIEKQNSDERQKKAEEENQKKIAQIKAVGDTMSALSDAVGKETAVGKALGIAQATINTYLGATEVLRAKSVLPEPAGTVMKLANVAAIIASGIKSVKAIASTKVPGGGGGGGGNMPTPSLAPIAPQMSSTAMNQQMINQMGNASTRAFVLESDVSGNQERIRRLNRAARIN